MEKCKSWFGYRHKWGKWVENYRKDVVIYERWKTADEGKIVGLAVYLERECEVCGMKDFERKEVSMG